MADWSAYSQVAASVRDVYELGDKVKELKAIVTGSTGTAPDGTTVTPSSIDFAATVVD